MTEKTIGRWQIEVSDPSPCWFTLHYGGQEIHNVPHSDLRDLKYAVESAIRMAEEKLGPTHRHEV